MITAEEARKTAEEATARYMGKVSDAIKNRSQWGYYDATFTKPPAPVSLRKITEALEAGGFEYSVGDSYLVIKWETK